MRAVATINLADLVAGRALIPRDDSGASIIRPVTSLHFLPDDSLLYTFVRHGDKPALTLRGQAVSAYVLQGLVFGPVNGKLLKEPGLPVHSPDAEVIAVNDRDVIAEDGNVISLLTADLLVEKKLALPPPPHQPPPRDKWTPRWEPRASYTGNSVLLQGTSLLMEDGPWLWLDAQSLELTRRWSVTKAAGPAISDSQIAMLVHYPDSLVPLVLFRGLDTPWRAAAVLPPLSDTINVFFTGPGEITYSRFLARLDGSGVRKLPAGAGPIGFGPAVAASGWRAIFGQHRERGGFAALDVPAHAEITGLYLFDCGSLQPTDEIRVLGSRARDPRAALSRNGNLLALLSADDSRIEIYELSPPSCSREVN